MHPVRADALIVQTPRGLEVQVVVDMPEGAPLDQALPAIVIAPGAGADMSRPMIAGLADRATRAGMIAVRFNWAYFTSGEDRTPDRSTELEDMQAVIAHILRDLRVDGSRFFIAGKSLGSIIAWAASAEHSHVSLYLMTPVCRSSEEFAALYPDFPNRRNQTRVLLGDADPLCLLPVLYNALSAREQGVPVAVLPGDHSLRMATAEATAANTELALDVLSHWLETDLRALESR